METNTIHTGDCFDVLSELPPESVHAVVSDPPYGLAFMGRDWDDFEPKEYQEWCEKWATEVKRVLKPGGHMLAFSGNRTHHRLFTGVEDAGFEIRDTLTWHYGSGFPKASDISKTIDKRKDYGPLQEFRKKLEQRRESSGVSKKEIREHFGVDSRLVTMWMGETEDPQATSPTPEQWRDLREMLNAEDLDDEWQAWRDKVGKPSPDWFDRDVVDTRAQRANSDKSNIDLNNSTGDVEEITAPATEAAKKWHGWKTGLKPSTEFVVMARKPYDGATVDSVLEHGTGALNIGACRVATDDDLETPVGNPQSSDRELYGDFDDDDDGAYDPSEWEQSDKGRYPSNLIFDEVAAEQLDADVGDLPTGDLEPHKNKHKDEDLAFQASEFITSCHNGDSGGPSRYFYTSKASKAERTLDGKIDNAHPTVKPTDLMEWLVKLVTAENQIVLDPFCGSGTTCMAAKNLNRRFIGIERQPKWADVARVRVGLTPDDPSVVRGDSDQSGLEAFEVGQ